MDNSTVILWNALVYIVQAIDADKDKSTMYEVRKIADEALKDYLRYKKEN